MQVTESITNQLSTKRIQHEAIDIAPAKTESLKTSCSFSTKYINNNMNSLTEWLLQQSPFSSHKQNISPSKINPLISSMITLSTCENSSYLPSLLPAITVSPSASITVCGLGYRNLLKEKNCNTFSHVIFPTKKNIWNRCDIRKCLNKFLLLAYHLLYATLCVHYWHLRLNNLF